MPKKKTISRKKQPPFKKAYVAVKSLLAERLKEREFVRRRLKQLNDEIPNLERTAAALDKQLHPALSEASTGKLHLSEIGTFTKEQMNEMFPGSTDIPPEIRAQLPPEDLSQFGSHYGDGPAPKEDFLPEITGKPVLPEKP